MGRRTLTCLALSALAILPAAATRSQEMTLQQLVDRMEAAAAELRGLRLRLDPAGGFVPPALLESDREGNVRLVPWSTSVVPVPSGREIILADGAWHFIDSQFYFAAADPGRRAEKLTPAACDRLDPAFIPSSMRPQGAFATESAYAPFLLLLSPRRMLAFERDLRLLGKRLFDGEECWVLRCEKDLGPPSGPQVKKFLVGVRDHRLRAATGYSFTVGQNTKWTARYDGAGLPSRVSLTGGLGWTWTAEWDLKSATREPGPARITAPDDLYATHARHPDLEDRLKAAPEDPGLLAGVALRSGRAEDWEKVVAKRPALTPLVNLISRYAKEVAGDKLAALARRLEEDPKALDAAVMEAARALNRLGEPDRALAVLKRYGPEAAAGVLEARSDAWALKGDAAKMVGEILPLILRKEKPRTWIWSQVPPASSKIDAQELLHRLGEALEAHSSCVALHLTRLYELARQERCAEYSEAARRFLALKPPADQVRV
ncbi:MAG TPA: hypothetical protein VK661_07620, partial [Planctomycetota bacterium]|nr:hypothetical protein [Planctomycetota bacterium]